MGWMDAAVVGLNEGARAISLPNVACLIGAESVVVLHLPTEA